MEVDYSSTMDIENEIGAYMIATVAVILLRSDLQVQSSENNSFCSSSSAPPGNCAFLSEVTYADSWSCDELAQLVNSKLRSAEKEDFFVDPLALNHGLQEFKENLRGSKGGFGPGRCGLRWVSFLSKWFLPSDTR